MIALTIGISAYPLLVYSVLPKSYLSVHCCSDSSSGVHTKVIAMVQESLNKCLRTGIEGKLLAL